MTITPEEIAEWRKVCEEATAGPWVLTGQQTDGRVEELGEITSPAGCVCAFGREDGYDSDAGCDPNEADSTFITTARTAMPRLLDELAAKDALIAKYRGALESIADYEPNLFDRGTEVHWRMSRNKARTALQASEES